MTTSGTFNFNPALADFVINAFAKCGVKRTELTAQHMQDARFEANLLMSDWAGDGVQLWNVQSATFPLTQGTINYPLPANLTFILDVYIKESAYF